MAKEEVKFPPKPTDDSIIQEKQIPNLAHVDTKVIKSVLNEKVPESNNISEGEISDVSFADDFQKFNKIQK